MKARQFILIILSFTFVALALVGCASGGKETIKIATIGPLTGESAKMGQDISQAVQLAVDQWNEKGGIMGRKIELLTEDDRADPKDAVSVASKVISQGVVGVVGHYNSSCTIPASNLYNEAGIVMVTPASTNPMVTERGYPGVFRTCGRDDQQGKVEADFAANVLKVKRVVILHDKTTYGQGLADEFKKNLPASVEVVLYEGITRGDKDFSAILTRAKGTTPDLMMFGGLYGEGGLLSKQMRDLGLQCMFLSGDGVYDPEYIRIAGPAAEGTYVSYAPSAGSIPSAMAFLKAYKARWPEVGPYSLFAYDAANVLLIAISNVGSTDGHKVNAYIHHNRFAVASGTIEYNEKGDPMNSPYVMWQVVGGKLQQLGDSTPKAVHVETH